MAEPFARERRDFACGCWYEAVWSEPGCLESYHHVCCSECYDTLFEVLDSLVLAERSQLTLDLASQRERPEETRGDYGPKEGAPNRSRGPTDRAGGNHQ